MGEQPCAPPEPQYDHPPCNAGHISCVVTRSGDGAFPAPDHRSTPRFAHLPPLEACRPNCVRPEEPTAYRPLHTPRKTERRQFLIHSSFLLVFTIPSQENNASPAARIATLEEEEEAENTAGLASDEFSWI